jgi:hypothetical protein
MGMLGRYLGYAQPYDVKATETSIGAGVFLRNPLWLLGLVSVPIAVESVRVAARSYNDIPRLVAANASTVKVYQLVGLAMLIAGLIIASTSAATCDMLRAAWLATEVVPKGQTPLRLT